MSLDAALSIAAGSLANINRQIALVSQNVANASTPNYVREVSRQESVTADGIGMGVRSDPAQRSVDAVLQASSLAQNGTVSALSTRQSALAAIDSTLGTPGAGTDLSSLVGSLQDAFTTLGNDPSSETQQQAVVGAASTLANGIRTMSASYTTQRQAAQDAIVAGVSALNTAFDTVGSLTTQIINLKAAGQSTADLENQRDASLQTISKLVGLKTLEQPNGNVVLVIGSGLSPPLTAKDPFSASAATVDAGSSYPGGGIPGIMLGGADVTAQITGGSIGANVALRDTDLPTDQAELDEFAQGLASRFDAQGLRLFTDTSGNLAAGGGSPVQSGYVGFSSSIAVNPAVTTTPSLVRDGTGAVAGSTTGASAFTPNPAGGPAGFTDLITRVLDYTFGSQVQSGVDQPALNVSGLGATGALSAPYSGSGSLSTLASSLVGAQSQASADTTTRLASEQALQTTLQSKISSENGVNIDTEMSMMVQLQNAYGASARIISAAQAMWNQLLNSVQ
jgi:flagellar hook-associated protein 1 FlgK